MSESESIQNLEQWPEFYPHEPLFLGDEGFDYVDLNPRDVLAYYWDDKPLGPTDVIHIEFLQHTMEAQHAEAVAQGMPDPRDEGYLMALDFLQQVLQVKLGTIEQRQAVGLE